jgi:hypothetical protein
LGENTLRPLRREIVKYIAKSPAQGRLTATKKKKTGRPETYHTAFLTEVYSFLNLLLNYWYPTLRLIAKEKLPSGRYKKIYEKEPKTPYRRLLESPDISEGCKDELRRRAAALNPVALKRCLDEARDRLLKLSEIECSIPSDKVS